MNGVFGSVFSIIWLVVIFTIIKKATEKGKANTHYGTSSVNQRLNKIAKRLERLETEEEEELPAEHRETPHPSMPRRLKAGEARPAHASLRSTSALSETFSEDRQHDWLARQIREEKKRVVWNNFVDLGAAHDEACAAELNRRDHRREHQSYVVDDGVSDN